MNKNTNKTIKISLLSALALILMYFEFPVIPIFPWLKIDLSDVPALLGAFGFGPLAGVTIELIKNILILLVKGSQTGFVGELANFLIGVSLVLPAGIIYKRNKSKKSAILGMILGGIFIEIVGVIANVYMLLPAYGMQMSSGELLKYVTVGLLPFNGIKAIIVSMLTYILYKKVSVSIFKAEPNFGSPEKNSKTITE
ncbi:UNVERIFIED_ORG: ECF transporter S component [Clostridium botulinum]|uniref:Riboflavin transporter n=1 Tax=Clostridium botulinum TaxID=1491 RepID=A0A6B4MIJ2_CLOBO|nr:ECF transporter S component [Clostridium botulinum]ACD53422.1 riboflavin transporter [Clostridium botulinum E3 str. Alaska E43]AJF28566.1 membrane protein [Clostridium botulinum]AJF31627.1 membrane protein [Clostridium botulinum]EES47998.1 riboflavin transporter [Clostridium botulinum E1 str. 'BoNT E Beluga']KIL08784.1 membrane protein [Clostridium botulinum]